MKIGIITFHFPYNCGASLQCYALSKKLEKMGHEVCVIDYCPDYHKNLYKPLRNPFVAAKRGWKSLGKKANILKKIIASAKAFVVALYSWKNYSGMKKADKIYGEFVKNKLNLTRQYKTLLELKNNPPVCDLYISGSDQLWNQAITGNSFDKAYFLKFGDDSVSKITYAVSTRFDEKGKELEEELKELLNGLDAIAVREANDLPIIQKIANELNIPVTQTLDPTLLLEEQDYEELLEDAVLEASPYIFTYSISSNTQVIVNKITNDLKEKEKLKVVNAVCYPKMVRNATDTTVVGPGQFLWYIKNAKYVVTDSFHATVFSILFGKNFINVPRGSKDVRVEQLLKKLGIDGHVSKESNGALGQLTNIDYSNVYSNLNDIRKSSVEYLEKRINLSLESKKEK